MNEGEKKKVFFWLLYILLYRLDHKLAIFNSIICMNGDFKNCVLPLQPDSCERSDGVR